MKTIIILLLLVAANRPAFCDEADDCFKRGKEKFWRGDTNGAMAEFDNVIKLEPTYLNAYPNRAFLRQARGDFDGAIADYTKAIELKPDNVEAYNNRGNVKLSKGELKGALDDFSRAVELKPDFTKARKRVEELKKLLPM